MPKCRGTVMSEEVVLKTLGAIIDSLDAFDAGRVTSCDGCATAVLRKDWMVAKYHCDFCEVCLMVGQAEDVIGRLWKMTCESGSQ